MCSRASCLGDPYCSEWRGCSPDPGDREMERSKLKSPAKGRFCVAVSSGKMGTICKGDFRLDRSFLDLRGRCYSNTTQSNRDRPGRTLMNAYTLRDPSLAHFCPGKPTAAAVFTHSTVY